MQYGQLYERQDTIEKLAGLFFAPESQMKVSQLYAWVKGCLDDIENVRQRLVGFHAIRNVETNQIVINDNGIAEMERPEEFVREFSMLMSQEIESIPEHLLLTKEDFDSVRGEETLSVGEQASLAFLMKDGEVYDSKADELWERIRNKE